VIGAALALAPAVPIAAVAVGLFVAAAVLAAIGRRRVAHTVGCTSALVGFFACWVAGAASGHPAVGIALFAGAIATFRLMNRYERPPQR
jgi:uncharacterized membrane protein (DUF4010 family)